MLWQDGNRRPVREVRYRTCKGKEAGSHPKRRACVILNSYRPNVVSLARCPNLSEACKPFRVEVQESSKYIRPCDELNTSLFSVAGRPARRHGDHVFHVYVLSDHTASFSNHTSHLGSVCGNQRAANCDCVWVTPDNSSAGCDTGQGLCDILSRLLWDNTDACSFSFGRKH